MSNPPAKATRFDIFQSAAGRLLRTEMLFDRFLEANMRWAMLQNADYSSSIKQLLDHSGSDKGKWYGGLYEVLLQPTRHAVKSLVEIGIGTLIPNAPSSMVGYASADYR